jgi:hypothetical protein
MGICLFTIGIYAIYVSINLMMPPIEEEFLEDSRKCTRIKA